ncbi:MAG: hypothetical protein ACLQU3_13855 [Limisphaerales bacterium]
MRRLSVFAFVVSVLAAEVAQAQILLGDGTTVVFATVGEAKPILTCRDDFVRCMSPFDRAARMKTEKGVSEKDYLEFVGKNVLEWNDGEKRKVTLAFQGIQTNLEGLSLPFPKQVLLVKTTGDEEGRAPYTRANVIILPKGEIATPTAKLQKTICHELFHILSRANPELREKLYLVIGFEKCDEVEFPSELKSRKITNPDAPANDHCIRLTLQGKDGWAIPILFSRAEKYDTARGGEFFDYLQFQFLVVEHQGKAHDAKPAYDGLKPRLVDLQQTSGFFEQVGRNTEYIIHPEEILADNFALLILEEHDALSPGIIKKMKEVLKAKGTAEPNGPANESQPIRPETNRTSSAAGSRR